MKLRLSQDARPQAMTLLIAAALSVLLWLIPYAEIVIYPFRIFVTFIHEGGHAIAALLTGHSVESLSVATDTSGKTLTALPSGTFSAVFISSAGYLGAMLYGALLLVLIRKAIAARIVLLSSAVLIFGLTIIFGLIKPVIAFELWSAIPFTLLSGTLITAALVLIAKFASARVASFFVSFLAVQCVLNAIFDLKTLFWLSTPFAGDAHTDAANMALATGVPAIIWVMIWGAVALGILWFAMRMYVAGRDQSYQPDLPFEETPPVV